MKALTISQPYASLIASGEKWVENRHWSTNYRGLLLIHAGKGTQYLDKDELAEYPNGCVVAIAWLANCFHRTTIKRNASFGWSNEIAEGCDRSWLELSSHPHTEGPYCWILKDVRAIETIPCRGAQGLWTPTAEILEQMRPPIAKGAPTCPST